MIFVHPHCLIMEIDMGMTLVEIIIHEGRDRQVRKMFEEMHSYFSRGYTPVVKLSKKCKGCSLENLCLPKLSKTISVKTYLEHAVKEDE